MKLVNIGFGNMISANRLISIVSPESAPIKRVIREAEDKRMLINGQRSCCSFFLATRNGCQQT